MKTKQNEFFNYMDKRHNSILKHSNPIFFDGKRNYTLTELKNKLNNTENETV